MQFGKTAAALASLLAAGTCAAAGVKVYGAIDTGLTYKHVAESGGNSLEMTSGNFDGSRLGLKCSEDLGNGLSVGFILLMSRRIKNMAGLLVGGIMIGYICSAVTDFVVTFAEDSDIVNLHGWSQGSFSGMSWSNVAISAAVIGITFVITFLMAKPIGAYELGEA